jgi:anti-sigma factor RsiW
MKCEDFEVFGLHAERDTSLSEAERAAAAEHARTCSRCAALQDSWRRAHAELRVFAEDTVAAQTPARVEMRLRQEFRTQHRTYRWRLAAVAAAWALAAAAVLAGAVSWKNWLTARREETARHLQAPQSGDNVLVNGTRPGAAGSQGVGAADDESDASLVANNELNDFTLLPGVLPAETDESEIFRVRMQRGELGALGLPVNEERAAEWIQVDLLVGNDGLPQAVRLPQENENP